MDVKAMGLYISVFWLDDLKEILDHWCIVIIVINYP